MPEGRWRVYALACAAALAVAAVAAAGRHPSAAAPAPQGEAARAPRLLVLNKADHTLAIVDPATMQVVARVPTGEGPHEVAVSADGRTAYVSNYGAEKPGNSLSVIDLAVFDAATRKELKRFQMGEGLVGVAVSGDSRRAFAASMATGKVTAVNLESMTVAGSVQTGQAPDGLAWVE